MSNIEDIGLFRSQVSDLDQLPDYRYENVFRVYNTDNDGRYYFYNILTKISLGDDGELDPETYYERIVQQRQAWSVISFMEYGTMDLWWLILLINRIENPIMFVPPGTKLKILKSEYIRAIVDSIKRQLA